MAAPRASSDFLDALPIEAGWRLAERLLLCCGIANLLLALLVWLFGASLHPLFSDAHAALLFVVTGLGLLAHGAILGLMRWRLVDARGHGRRMARRARSFMRLPLNADFSPARRLARLRMAGRPSIRARP